MAGMGPPPKPAGQRRRTNATIAMQPLPMEGYSGPVPEWPFVDGGSMAELERWNRVWGTPMAAMWIRMHIDLVVARYVRVCLLIEDVGDANVTVAGSNLHSEARQLEDRLGLSPLALLRLRWEISPDEVTEQRESKPAPRRRLKAVDPNTASG